jgi:hypothetical protein
MTPTSCLVGCQRWRRGRSSYRPAGEPIDPTRYGVELLAGDTTPRDFVIRHHYMGSYPAARCRVGLYRMRELVGVAVFSVPASEKVLPKWLPGLRGVDLGRLVLLDDVPANGETWFLARALKVVRGELGVDAVMSMSDPFVRTAVDGTVVKPGHVGVIYQALGARYLGRSNRNTIYVAPDGRTFNNVAQSKLRTGRRGRAYAAGQVLDLGGPERDGDESAHEWLARAREGWRRVRHPGNHVYAWSVADGAELRPAKTPPCSWCGESHLREAA